MKPTRFLCVNFAAGAVLLTGLGGCVERKITIGSGPPGALVYLNDVEVGRTPVTVPFTWYGDYDIRMRLDREEGQGADRKTVEYYLHTHERARAPWFQWLGVDLFAEILPFQFKDDKVWAFNLERVQQPSDADLIQRAEQLKGQLDAPAELQNQKKKAGSGAMTRPK
ncbi:MAG TPA: PEGA domain-containing protein [Phycisphaerae bacterium]|nr:PEGA domain-containing protein [Phycisphaerae bacterium]